MHTCIHIHTIIYIYIYVYLVRHGNVLMFVFCYGFHRRDSRGPVAAGNHTKNKPTTETVTKNVPCHDGNHKTPMTETIRKRCPATKETIRKPATETTKQKKRFPRRRKP